MTLTNVVSALDQHNLKQASNDILIGVPEMVKVLSTIYENIEVPADYTMISNEFSVDLTLNWLLNVYDRYQIKIGININATLVYWIRQWKVCLMWLSDGSLLAGSRWDLTVEQPLTLAFTGYSDGKISRY